MPSDANRIHYDLTRKLLGNLALVRLADLSLFGWAQVNLRSKGIIAIR